MISPNPRQILEIVSLMSKEMTVDEPVTRSNQEAMWVEKSGANSIVQVKFPCGNKI
jgi:hypothetical protein